MKHSRLALLALLCLFAAFLADVSYFSRQLPNRVATHFNASGQPNGWMTRADHLKFTCIAGIGTSLFVLGVFAFVRRVRGWGLNIPNKAYWLEPERQRETFEFIGQHSFWLAALVLLFHAGVFHAILSANLHTPAVLPMSHVAWLAGGFLPGIAVWLITLLIRFRRPTPP